MFALRHRGSNDWAIKLPHEYIHLVECRDWLLVKYNALTFWSEDEAAKARDKDPEGDALLIEEIK